jgi:hypothetical protein
VDLMWGGFRLIIGSVKGALDPQEVCKRVLLNS